MSSGLSVPTAAASPTTAVVAAAAAAASSQHSSSSNVDSTSSGEIPESVTAELEKLEQEGHAGSISEVGECVGALLSDLGDDDELLGK